MYQSTYVRYERRGDRVVPVRVTKSWVGFEVRQHDNRKEPKQVRKFIATQLTELRRFPRPDYSEGKPEWPVTGRVETRERLLTLPERGVKDGEPLVREAGYDQCWLPYSVPAQPTAAQAAWTLENGNGWLP